MNIQYTSGGVPLNGVKESSGNLFTTANTQHTIQNPSQIIPNPKINNPLQNSSQYFMPNNLHFMQSQSAQLTNQNDNSQDTASKNAYTQASSASNLHINDLQCNANIASGNAIDTRAQTACANFNENRFNFTMSSNNPQIYMPNNYPSVPHVAANPFRYRIIRHMECRQILYFSHHRLLPVMI